MAIATANSSQKSFDVGFELLTLYVIRDNLVLNVWMLLAPNRTILDWQAGA